MTRRTIGNEITLLGHAERELREAGLLDADSEYGGKLGRSVLELVKIFAAQGHSGFSAHCAIDLFSRVAARQLLTPLTNPIVSGEYIDMSEMNDGKPMLQSTRDSSVFSEDGGRRWFTIDKRVPRWKRWLGVKRAYITF